MVEDEEDQQDREGAQRKAVCVVDTGSTVGDGEAAGRRLERVWDGAAIHRGVSLPLTMMGQSTDVVAWSRAALGPWLGGLYTCMYINAVDTRWRWPEAKVKQRGSRKLAAVAAWNTSGEKARLGGVGAKQGSRQSP